MIRGLVDSPDVASAAHVWLQEPHHSWERVARVQISSQGRMSWTWIPTQGDVHNYASWRFRFIIQSDEWRSGIVKVRIRSNDF